MHLPQCGTSLDPMRSTSNSCCCSLVASAVCECGDLACEACEVTVPFEVSEAIFGFAESEGGPAQGRVAAHLDAIEHQDQWLEVRQIACQPVAKQLANQ